jgi:hypothetical protein
MTQPTGRPTMSCEEALLVFLDRDLGAGEHRRRARLHASTCPRCARSYHDPEATSEALARVLPALPGLSRLLRATLVALAAIQAAVAGPWLFGASLVPHSDVAVAHLTRDGAFGLVAACAALLAAWRPRYVVPALLVGSVVLLAQIAAGFVDQQASSVSSSFELTHALVLLMLGALAAATASARHDARGSARTPPTLHSL